MNRQAHCHLRATRQMIPPETSFNASTATLKNEAHDQTQPEDCSMKVVEIEQDNKKSHQNPS